MDVFITIFSAMISLYLMMFLGYVSGKFFKVDTKPVATLVVFVISPIVFMLTVAKMNFTGGAIIVPLVIMVVCGFVSLAMKAIGRYYLPEKTLYLSALMSGTSNWGYFGVPIAFFIFDPSIVALYVLIGFGTMLFESSLGIYYISRGNFSPLESLKNVLKYPVVYAIILGILMSYYQYEPPVMKEEFFQLFKGAYIVLGMMIIGLGIANMERFTIDWRFLGTVFGLKFVIWPLISLSLVWLDKTFLGFISEDFYAPLLLFSFMPMGANNIAFAAKYEMNPGKAAVAALASTIFALFYVPIAITLLGL